MVRIIEIWMETPLGTCMLLNCFLSAWQGSLRLTDCDDSLANTMLGLLRFAMVWIMTDGQADEMGTIGSGTYYPDGETFGVCIPRMTACSAPMGLLVIQQIVMIHLHLYMFAPEL